MNIASKISILLILFFSTLSFNAQEKDSTQLEHAISGLKFRSIGPAFMSGRIADIVIDPNNQNIWYVAVGSGGVWKTINSGTTWQPLTDKESFYSTGCLTIDPNNSNNIWLGTGENVGGRHVGIGHGLYLSRDGGKQWENKGLKNSEHISKIIINPKNSQEIWVAAQGPLWSSGGDRGLYKTTDGGNTWRLVLSGNKWTGVTDILIDPRNEKVLYAATWQRHRNVAAYIGGGEDTAIHKSIDGGETWEKLTNGLPKTNMGKIGLAISPINPNVIYAAIELERRKGGVFRSENQGQSWVKMSNTVSGGTGPHYYQELIASPHEFDKLYLMNNSTLYSTDGGKTFKTMKKANKHGDDHSLTFKLNDPNYMLIGTDGGIYESFDKSETWRFVNNLPITQFYKLAVDDTKPFYNIYGGTQDNNTQGGPSRTLRSNGISNSDWHVLLGGDGHQPATEPGNPNIVYAQSQQGELRRVEKSTGQSVYIKPQSGIDEPYERNNWDSPILVSHHSPKRLYFGSQRVWRSNNRGDSWKPISKDLTKNEERLTLPIMGKQRSWDSAWDVYAMSTYNTITSLSESKLDENIIFAGTDDGIIQRTKDGGNSWVKTEVGSLPSVPSTAFVNDIKTDLHDKNKVYIALDNHKFGDYKPYLLKSNDGGKSWNSITNGLPNTSFVWRIVQDHINPNLLFLAAEYGVYVSLNQGDSWMKFSQGLPTISFRDIAIQKRENDLIVASFGRSFYVLDDYTPLRSINPSTINKAQLFKPRKALQYQPINGGTSSQGASFYTAENPDYGALFTYYIPENFDNLKSKRQKKEKLLNKENKNIPFPGWKALSDEKHQDKPNVILVIRNDKGEFITRIQSEYKRGINRVTWNLKQPLVSNFNMETINTTNPSRYMFSKPGIYNVTLYSIIEGETIKLGETQNFSVERIRENILKNPMSDLEISDYSNNIIEFKTSVNTITNDFKKASKKLKAFDKILKYANLTPGKLEREIHDLKKVMYILDEKINGNSAKKEIREKEILSIRSRISIAQRGFSRSTYGPTEMHLENFEIAKQLFSRLKPKLESFSNLDVPKIENLLKEAGVPIILD